jgi:hypothetical protein
MFRPKFVFFISFLKTILNVATYFIWQHSSFIITIARTLLKFSIRVWVWSRLRFVYSKSIFHRYFSNIWRWLAKNSRDFPSESDTIPPVLPFWASFVLKYVRQYELDNPRLERLWYDRNAHQMRQITPKNFRIRPTDPEVNTLPWAKGLTWTSDTYCRGPHQFAPISHRIHYSRHPNTCYLEQQNHIARSWIIKELN